MYGRSPRFVMNRQMVRAPESQIALLGWVGSFVVLLDPFRIAVLQHVRDPHSLRGGVGGRQFVVKREAVRRSRPTVPGFQPTTVDMLRSKDSFDPSGTVQIRPAGGQQDGGPLQIDVRTSR